MTNPTAGVLLIGNEILSGRTRDINLNHIALALGEVGIRVCECRVISDHELAIVEAINVLRQKYSYVFTTGGIGPTHDDITAQCVASAFSVPLLQHPQAVQRLQTYFAERGVEANEARMRMANVPDGGVLIDNPVSVAPGFRVDNVCVMAGVPKIMQAMLANVIPTLDHGDIVNTVTVVCNLPEGLLSAPLGQLQTEFQHIEIGCYPGKDINGYRVALVARGIDQLQLKTVQARLLVMVGELGGVVLEAPADQG